MKDKTTILICLLLILVAVLSIFPLGNRFSSPAAYAGLSASIDKKSSDALLLTGTATVASAAVTLLPGDVATPIAEKISDFTEYFLAALCVLYAEKYLLPILGLTFFRIMVPAVCLIIIICLLSKRGRTLRRLVARIMIFTLILWLAIPVSIRVSDIVYVTYEESIENTMQKANNLTEDISVFENSNGTSFVQRATDLVNSLVESLTVAIVTSCIIPILVLLFFIWISRQLLGVVIPSPFSQNRKRPLQSAAAEGGRRVMTDYYEDKK